MAMRPASNAAMECEKQRLWCCLGAVGLGYPQRRRRAVKLLKNHWFFVALNKIFTMSQK